jgi:hypothetical protein
MIRIRAFSCCLIFLLLDSFAVSYAQHPGNTNAAYQQLRGLLPGDDVITIKNLELRRDAATFTFEHGSIAFYGKVNGKVTGAVFKGQGHFHLTPPTAEERRNLKILNQSEEFDEDFDQVVLRFSDATAAELHQASTGYGEQDKEYAKVAQEFHNFERLKLKDNLDLRLLEDVLSPTPGGYFAAAIHGKKNSHLVFTADPHGAASVEPEEILLLNWNDWGATYLTAFHQATDAARGGGKGDERNATFRIDSEDLDVSIEKGGFLTGLATIHLTAEKDGVAVTPFDLYPTLRVSHVETEKGEALDFVQEKKEEDADFGVVLAGPLKKGESATISVAYGGKDVVKNEGNMNYYPVGEARESWYPNSSSGWGDYVSFHMLFHVPKGLQLIATGTKVNEKNEGKITTTEWKTEVPLAVVGFNLGEFTMKEATVGSLTIDAYANTRTPDGYTNQAELPQQIHTDSQDPSQLGTVNTASMLPVQLSQGEVAAKIYTTYFGQLPFSHIALTQQYACNYGQSWPMLVYLPICGFIDSTMLHFRGIDPADMYWKVVTPHEVAHQWWGQTVGFRSYRDQWMSEGFAQTSASIFLQATRPKPNDFREFWKEQRRLIAEKNAMGFRPIDVGPVTMGYRLSTQKTGWDIYQNLVYPKGAYILHMIRMMMWTPKEGDARFIETMHDFVDTYRLKPATTEEFKAIVEKHMSSGMDIDRNHRMDWFFNEYVYGTELPTYHFESQITANGDAATLHFKLGQSGVPSSFGMVVPIYLELADGKIMRLGSATISGSSTVEQTVQLPKMPSPVKRALINYYYDVLAIEN